VPFKDKRLAYGRVEIGMKNQVLSLSFPCVGVVSQKFTLHLNLWICLLFLFGLFLSCGLSVGRGIVPHSHHGSMLRCVGVSVGVCWCSFKICMLRSKKFKIRNTHMDIKSHFIEIGKIRKQDKEENLLFLCFAWT
jgi:hypothetical protein